MTQKVAYLGPAGTFTEAAAIKYAPGSELLALTTTRGVVNAVMNREADEGIVPIENSLEGSVTDTLDLLIHDSPLNISNEVVIPIEHCLLVQSDTEMLDIEVIYSHPQALGQCRQYLNQYFPNAVPVSALSTAAAAEQLEQSQTGAAAIGTLRAAELYGLKVLARGIQDNSSNVTRFVVLADTDHLPTGNDKTSLCFTFEEDKPGILHHVLGIFANRGINLLKVESRPTKQSLGRYIFLLDLKGHREDTAIVEALEVLSPQVSMLKIFGSYPQYVEDSND